MSSISLSTKVSKSTKLISLITVIGDRYVVRIEPERLPSYDTKDVDAFDIPAESLKAILWNKWQRAWGLQPPDPGCIKLIQFGQTINDFTALRCSLKFHTATFVHMGIESPIPDDAGFQEEDESRAYSCPQPTPTTSLSTHTLPKRKADADSVKSLEYTSEAQRGGE